MIPNDLTGMKSEVIIQKSHRVGYDHAIRNCGVKLVEVESQKELESAINENTAMMWFYNNQNPIGKVRDEEFVAIGKKHGIPTFNDCAAGYLGHFFNPDWPGEPLVTSDDRDNRSEADCF